MVILPISYVLNVERKLLNQKNLLFNFDSMFDIWSKKFCIHPDKIAKWIVEVIQIEITSIEEKEEANGNKYSVYNWECGKIKNFFETEFAHTMLFDNKKECIEKYIEMTLHAIDSYEKWYKMSDENIKKIQTAKKEMQKNINLNRKFLIQLKWM